LEKKNMDESGSAAEGFDLDVAAFEEIVRRELDRQLEGGEMPASEKEQYKTVATEWIMETIRAALEEQGRSGQLTEPDMARYQVLGSPPEELDQHLRELNTRWDQLYEPFEVKSRTPLIGELWASLRRHIHQEVRSYLDPMIWRQSELNAAFVSSLNLLTTGLYGGSLARSLQKLYQEIAALREQVQTLEEQLRRMESHQEE
jgi:O-antigen chain-terminating methyltransferase